MTSPKISRRAVLRGLGTMVALPALESLTPARALASTAAPTPSPLRMAFYYVPNGAHMAAWTPAAEGAEFTLPATLAAAWAAGDQVSIEADQPLRAGEVLKILVEKDFACLKPRDDEDETDAYPHPSGKSC